MTETEIMRTEIARVMSRAHPPVVMSLDDVADFFGYSKSHVKCDVVCKPTFPKPLDRFASPRWARKSVMEWAGVQ
jgi:predicted DNA-binding transcriptional regulator AlpA